MWVVSVPISVQVSKNKRFSLNLNVYRNANHHTLNKAKIEFCEQVIPLLKDIPFLTRIRLSYILYSSNAQLSDVSNICSIVDKFFSDVLVTAKKIPDDNRNFIPLIAYGWGDVDRNNPRVDVIIEAFPK